MQKFDFTQRTAESHTHHRRRKNDKNGYMLMLPSLMFGSLIPVPNSQLVYKSVSTLLCAFHQNSSNSVIVCFYMFLLLRTRRKYLVTPQNSCKIFLATHIISFSRIILVYYCKCCNLIGYSTRYLFIII